MFFFCEPTSQIGSNAFLRAGVYQSEAVSSPFVLGLVKPKIYLPFKILEQDARYVIAHEQAHIKRMDHLVKPFGFLLLALYYDMEEAGHYRFLTDFSFHHDGTKGYDVWVEFSIESGGGS